MRLTRVFIDAPLHAGATVEVPRDAANHLTRVLRLGAGDACVVFNGGGGEYAARIAATGRRTALELGAHDPVERELSLRIVLLQALARGERMDTVVQKTTELGVAAIQPVHTEHSGVKFDEVQAARKCEHWRAVAISACEQCQRNRVPGVLPPVSLARALADASEGAKLVLSLGQPGETVQTLTRAAACASATATAAITVLVGPEGGLSASEESLARYAGFVPVSLGPQVLRTETAAIAALAILGALVLNLQA